MKTIELRELYGERAWRDKDGEIKKVTKQPLILLLIIHDDAIMVIPIYVCPRDVPAIGEHYEKLVNNCDTVNAFLCRD